MLEDYYKILGVNKNSTEEEIKKAYYKQAHLHHPDRPGGNEEKFKKINAAYQILSNKEKRSQYDQFGQTFDQSGGFQGSPFSWGGQSSGFKGNNFSFNFEDLGGMEDAFGDIFSGFGFGRQQQRQTQRERGSDIQIEINLTLEETFSGKKKEIEYSADIICKECQGSGAKNNSEAITCQECGGKGKIKEMHNTFFGAFANITACSKCKGSGKIIKNPCPACHGKGKIAGKKETKIDIKPGIKNGQIIKIIGAGNAGEHNQKSGDLFLIVKITPHHLFKRQGDDLYIKKTINVAQASLGDEIDIPLIEGKTAETQIPSGISSGAVLRMKSKGMPVFGSYGRGDLFIEIEIKTPQKLSKKARELFEELKKEI